MSDTEERQKPQKEAKKPNKHQKKRHDRAQNFRKKENAEVMTSIKKDLDSKLFAEYDTLNQALQSLNISEQKQVINLPITTRGIGIITSRLAHRIHLQLPNVDIPINEWYRVSLAQASLKLINAQDANVLPLHRPKLPSMDMDLESRTIISTIHVNLAPLSNIINSIGNFSFNDVSYTPVISDVQAFSPTISTLRAFLDEATINANLIYSTYSCLPGAIWENRMGAVRLTNADDIFPRNYNRAAMREDIEEVKAFYANVTRKLQKFGGSISYGPDGLPSQLVSVQPTTDRVSCTYAEEDIFTIFGEEDSFYTPVPLSPLNYTLGMASLFGETIIQVPANTLQAQYSIRSPYSAVRKYAMCWSDVMSAIVA